MSGQFKVGQICIGQNHIRDLHKNGMECEIIVGYGIQSWRNPITGEEGQDMGYAVLWADGSLHACKPQFLRRKQPPSSAKAIMRAAILKAKQPVEVEA